MINKNETKQNFENLAFNSKQLYLGAKLGSYTAFADVKENYVPIVAI